MYMIRPRMGSGLCDYMDCFVLRTPTIHPAIQTLMLLTHHFVLMSGRVKIPFTHQHASMHGFRLFDTVIRNLPGSASAAAEAAAGKSASGEAASAAEAAV